MLHINFSKAVNVNVNHVITADIILALAILAEVIPGGINVVISNRVNCKADINLGLGTSNESIGVYKGIPTEGGYMGVAVQIWQRFHKQYLKGYCDPTTLLISPSLTYGNWLDDIESKNRFDIHDLESSVYVARDLIRQQVIKMTD